MINKEAEVIYKDLHRFITAVVNLMCMAAIIWLILTIGGWFTAMTASQPNKTTVFDAALECQKIAAQSTNSEWGYQACLKELAQFGSFQDRNVVRED